MRTDVTTFGLVFTYKRKSDGGIASVTAHSTTDYDQNLSTEGVLNRFAGITRDWDEDVTLVAVELIRKQVVTTETFLRNWNVD